MVLTYIPPELTDFIIDIGIEIAKRGISAGTEYLIDKFKESIGTPSDRLKNNLRDLAVRIQATRDLKWYQKLRRPRAELRNLTRVRTLLNLIRHEMIRYDSFFYFQPSLISENAMILFQTARAPHSRPFITEPAHIVAKDIPLKSTNKWIIEDASAMPPGDIQGVRNKSIVIRHLPLSLVNSYAPITSGLSLAAATNLMNIHLRLVGGQDPWPERVLASPVPSVYKIGWNSVALYDNYFPPDMLSPHLSTRLRVSYYNMNSALLALESGLLSAVFIHHPDWDPHEILSLKQ